MNKTEFVNVVSEKLGATKKDSKDVVNAFLDCIAESLAGGEDVNMPPFGKFTVVERAARKGRNPQTGEELDIPAKKAVKFKPSAKVKEAVNV